MSEKKEVVNLQIPDWILLNNQIVDEEGRIKDLDKDKEAAHAYFIGEVNKRTQFFHSLEEKIDHLVKNEYIEKEFLDQYTFDQIQSIFDYAYQQKFRFPTYMGAFKFYNDYALKTNDKKVFLERYEDRLAFTALYHGDGDIAKARRLIERLIAQDFTPATPTLLNTGKKRRENLYPVSC